MSDLTNTHGQGASYDQMCAVAMALDTVGQRWNLLILRDLTRTALRFSDIQAINPTMSPTLLSQRLRALVSAGLIEKRSSAGAGRASLYAMTDTARPVVTTLLTALADLGAHMLEQDPPSTDPTKLLAEQMQLNGHYVMARHTELEGYFVLDLTGWQTHLVVDLSGFNAHPTAPPGREPTATATFFPPTTLLRIMGLAATIEQAEADGLLAIEGEREPMIELIRLLSFPRPDASPEPV